MGYLDPPEERTGILGWFDRRTPEFWVYGFCTIVILVIILKEPSKLLQPYSFNLHMRATPYIWSPQCPKRTFRKGIEQKVIRIELGCAREQYRFTDESVKLLNYGCCKTPYYRIGNDLLAMRCGSKDCLVDYVMKDAYYQ